MHFLVNFGRFIDQMLDGKFPCVVDTFVSHTFHSIELLEEGLTLPRHYGLSNKRWLLCIMRTIAHELLIDRT